MNPPSPFLRILVVEDEAPLARCYARQLLPAVAEIASSPPIALAMLADLAPFDLVLCDLNLAGLSGRDLYRDACARWPELCDRFLFMTGDRATAPPRLDDASSAVRVLAKPFDRAALLAAVAEVARLRAGPSVYC